MDRISYESLIQLNLSNIKPISLEEFEQGDADLANAKNNRTRVEYYFTCTPSLPLYVLTNYPDVKMITYLDADLFFFFSPEPIFTEIGSHSIAIIGHRHSKKLQFRDKYGIYNVGWLSFKNDTYGLNCLNWWRKRCLRWCYDRVEPNRFADQKYLDDWPTRFEKTIIIQHKGANLAPWNIANYKITHRGNQILVDNQPLIFFHFHGLKQVTHWMIDPNFAVHKVSLSKEVKYGVFAPYIQILFNNIHLSATSPSTNTLKKGVRNTLDNISLTQRLVTHINTLILFCKCIITKNFILVKDGRVL